MKTFLCFLAILVQTLAIKDEEFTFIAKEVLEMKAQTAKIDFIEKELENLKTLKTEFETFKVEVTSLFNKFHDMKIRFDDLKKDVAILNDNFAANKNIKEQKFQTLAEDFKTVLQEMKEIKGLKLKQEQDIQKVKTDHEALKKNVRMIESHFNDKIGQNTETVKNFEAKIGQLSTEKKALQQNSGQIQNLNTQFKEMTKENQKTQEVLAKLTQESEILNPKIKCPTDDSNYQVIDGKCFFFEKNPMAFKKAQKNCGRKMAHGKLFEPSTAELNDKIWTKAKEIFGYGYMVWLGVSMDENRYPVYDSTGENVSFTNRWNYGQPTSLVRNQNCVNFYQSNFWSTEICSINILSICESNIQ